MNKVFWIAAFGLAGWLLVLSSMLVQVQQRQHVIISNRTASPQQVALMQQNRELIIRLEERVEEIDEFGTDVLQDVIKKKP